MKELEGPIDPATGLPCPICDDGTVVRTDATGRDDMLPELFGWSDVRARDPSCAREETIARAAAVTMLARAGAIDSQIAKTMRDALVAAFDSGITTKTPTAPPPSASSATRTPPSPLVTAKAPTMPPAASGMPNDAYASLALRLRVRLDAAATFGELANLANELGERAGIETKAVVVRANGAIRASYLLATWATSLLRAGEPLWDAARRADVLPIAIDLPSEHRAVAAEILGIGGLAESALDVAGDVDFAIDLVWASARAMNALARVGHDAWSLLASGATLHQEAEPARDFFEKLGGRAVQLAIRAEKLLEATRASPFGACPDDARAAAVEAGAIAHASVRAMRVALYHLVLDQRPRDPERTSGPTPERIAELIGAVRAGVFDVSYRVGNVRPLSEMRRAIDAETIG